MALFKKKRKKQEVPEVPELPKLPELPELPEFSEEEEDFSEEETPRYEKSSHEDNLSRRNEIPELPSFPNGSLGNKFSQNTIKEAVSGRDIIEEDEEPFEFQPSKKENRKEKRRPFLEEEKVESNPFEETEENPFQMSKQESVGEEPIFVRLDKFEEGSKDFDELRRKVTHIENMFDDIKKVREKEEKELELWKSELMNIKEKIEKIDRDIFSKLG